MSETRVFRWANFASTTLNGAINSVVTSVVVVDGSVVPDPDPGQIATLVLRDDTSGAFEILNVTNVIGNTLTVERGAEGTTPAAWASGHKVVHSLTAAWFQARGFTVPIPTVEYVDSLCAYGSGGVSPLNIGIPPLAEVGDLLLFMGRISVATTLSYPTGWNALGLMRVVATHDEILQDSVQDVLLYRFMQLGDTQITFPFAGALSEYGACIHAFRNVDTGRPFPQMYVQLHTTGATSGNTVTTNAVVLGPPMNRPHVGSIFAEFARGVHTAIGSVFAGATLEHDDPVLFLEAEDRTPAAQARSYLAVIRRGSQDGFSNLLPYVGNSYNTDWTNVQVSTDDFALSDPVRARIDVVDGTVGRHEVYQNVSLTAGQKYSITVYATQDNSGNVDDHYISLTPPVAAEFGSTWDRGTNVWGKTGTIGAGFLREFCKNCGQNGSPTRNTSCLVLTFIAPDTGIYRFNFGYTNTPGNPSSTYAFQNDGGFIYQLILAIGEIVSPYWESLRTGALPVQGVSGVPGFMLRGAGFVSTNGWNYYSVEIKAVGALTDLVRLTQGERPNTRLSADRLGVVDRGGNNSSSSVGVVATGCVDRFQNGGSGKFYYEVTCSAISAEWESVTSERSFFGVTTPWKTGVHSDTAGGISDSSPGTYLYSNTGRTSINNVVAGPFTPFNNPVDGDVVGVGVNFINNEITWYVNGGAPVATATIIAAHRDVPLRAGFIQNTASTGQRNFTVNFAGPFLYLPSGFIAYDWENS